MAENNEAASAEEAKEDEVEATEPAEEVKPAEAAQKIQTGMVVRVHVKIKDVTPRGEERERIQVFEGTVINKGGQDKQSATITVRKVSGGIGVERIFPLMMPNIEKIEVVKQYRTRRAKLFFLRDRLKKRLKEIGKKK
ncbi:MAG: 50S ribosomal protein L19 [Patescibacteria group bacterium]